MGYGPWHVQLDNLHGALDIIDIQNISGGVNEFGATGIRLLHFLESWASGAQRELTCKSSHLSHGLRLLLFIKFFPVISWRSLPSCSNPGSWGSANLHSHLLLKLAKTANPLKQSGPGCAVKILHGFYFRAWKELCWKNSAPAKSETCIIIFIFYYSRVSFVVGWFGELPSMYLDQRKMMCVLDRAPDKYRENAV